MVNATPAQQRVQLAEQRRVVDFDTYDVTVDELLRRVQRGRIELAPVYQRQFRWDLDRQSALIESVLLGIPVPPLFMATNQTDDLQNQWEVVDGLQRLMTLCHFAGDSEMKESLGVSLGSADKSLRIQGLDKLTYFNSFAFSEFPEDIKSALLDRPMRVVVLNDKSDLQVRYDLFERLNTGGIELTDQEIRECVFRGEFIDMLVDLAKTEQFRTVVKLPDRKWKDGTPEEYVLRFFAYSEEYLKFDHLVGEFLNNFTFRAHRSPEVGRRGQEFLRVFTFLAECFPEGIKSRKGQTPVVLFEALSVGAALALQQNPELRPRSAEWAAEDDELRKLTTGATNSRPRVRKRVEMCRDRFLGR